MNWNSVNDFLAMGGYALYVWGSVGMTAVLLVGEAVALKQRRKTLVSLQVRALRHARKGKQ